MTPRTRRCSSGSRALRLPPEVLPGEEGTPAAAAADGPRARAPAASGLRRPPARRRAGVGARTRAPSGRTTTRRGRGPAAMGRASRTWPRSRSSVVLAGGIPRGRGRRARARPPLAPRRSGGRCRPLVAILPPAASCDVLPQGVSRRPSRAHGATRLATSAKATSVSRHRALMTSTTWLSTMTSLEVLPRLLPPHPLPCRPLPLARLGAMNMPPRVVAMVVPLLPPLRSGPPSGPRRSSWRSGWTTASCSPRTTRSLPGPRP